MLGVDSYLIIFVEIDKSILMLLNIIVDDRELFFSCEMS